jgi:hypothetical protein
MNLKNKRICLQSNKIVNCAVEEVSGTEKKLDLFFKGYYF